MFHLRLVVPTHLLADVMARLESTPGVVHLARSRTTVTRPAGELVSCDVVREAANDLVEALGQLGLDRDGAIIMDPLEVVVSGAAHQAQRSAPGAPGDALVWTQLEARVRD